MTLEEQLSEQAKRGLLGLGLEQETAEEYAPWASLLAQFIPGVGEGVGIDNTAAAINDERYGDAAIEGGLTLLGMVPGVGDAAAAAIKGIRKAPITPKRSRKKAADRTPEEAEAHKAWERANYEKRKATIRENARRRYAEDPSQIRDHNKRWREQNQEAWKESDKKSRAKRAEAIKKQKAKHYQENKDEILAKGRAYREENLEMMLERERASGAKHRDARNARQRARYAADPSYQLAQNAKRKAAQLQRTPSWADDSKINEIYKSALEASAETGIPHHVDHVIPLRGKKVSGLHHQDNLLIVPGAENLSKSNNFEPGDLPPRAGIRKARKLLKDIRNGKKR